MQDVDGLYFILTDSVITWENHVRLKGTKFLGFSSPNIVILTHCAIKIKIQPTSALLEAKQRQHKSIAVPAR